jgi:hypothetical protein
MAIGSAGVVDRVNTSSGQAIQVIALYGIGGGTIFTSYAPPYETGLYIITQFGDIIATQNNDLLVTN